jgi:hypothetical protein
MQIVAVGRRVLTDSQDNLDTHFGGEDHFSYDTLPRRVFKWHIAELRRKRLDAAMVQRNRYPMRFSQTKLSD